MVSSVIIDNLYIKEVIAFDLKANPVLIINPNAVLSLPVSIEFLQTVAGGTRRSSRHPALSIMISFLNATD